MVRQADSPTSGGGVLGTIATLSGGGNSSDTDILYEFIKSQQLIELVDQKLDLRKIYNKPDNDPVFTLGPDASIEDLIWYWSYATRIFYDPGTGLIELRVLAFDPDDARNIADAISRQSSAMINELSAIAREDTTRYARVELDKAVERLKETRQTLTAFRNSSQIVDPTADVQGRMGLLNYLQQQLADTIIEQDLLQETARDNDPRLQLTQRKIIVIQQRIAEERQKIGLGDNGTGEAAAALVGQYEGLIVDREFAEQAYVKALSNYDAAIAEANRKSRYLAEYIRPTISQEAQYPQRYIITTLLGLFLFLFWFILLLVYYSIKDRR
ncbi:MAG: sugar transporter [Paracoccaceae bacterium]